MALGLNAQVSIDPNLQARFEKARNTFPIQFLNEQEKLKVELLEMEKVLGISYGDAYFTIFKIDTLNNSELMFRDYSGVELISLNGIPLSESKIDSLVTYAARYMQTEGEIIDNGVLIHINHIFGENFRLEIHGDSVSAHFAEVYWDSPTFSLTTNGSYDDKLEVPINLKILELDSKKIRVGDILHGYCEIVTAAPYYMTDSELDGQYLELSKEFAFYFWASINKKSGRPVKRW